MALAWEAVGEDHDPPNGRRGLARWAASALRFVATVSTSLPARLVMVMTLLCSAVIVFAGVQDDASPPSIGSAVVGPAAPVTRPAVANAPPALVYSTSRRFTPHSLGREHGLIRTASIAPAELCAAIGDGSGPMAWVPSPVHPDEWECVSDVPRSSQGDKDPVVFVMARGTNEQQVSYIRLKLSATGEAALDAGAKQLDDRLSKLFDALKWPVSERVSLSVRMLRPFDLDEGGTKIRLLKEASDEGRYNLIVTFPPRSVGTGFGDQAAFIAPLHPLKTY